VVIEGLFLVITSLYAGEMEIVDRLGGCQTRV